MPRKRILAGGLEATGAAAATTLFVLLLKEGCNISIGSFIGGRYSATLAASGYGITRDGYELMLMPKGELINQTDAWAQALIEFFFQGCDADLITEGLEYSLSIGGAWPWGTLGTMGIIARLGSAISGALVLTAASGTPAASSPATLTATRAIVAPGSQVALRFSSRLRSVPTRFNLLPSDAGAHFS